MSRGKSPFTFFMSLCIVCKKVYDTTYSIDVLALLSLPVPKDEGIVPEPPVLELHNIYQVCFKCLQLLYQASELKLLLGEILILDCSANVDL